MLMRIAALSDPGDQQRQLLKIARYLAPAALRAVVLGQGPIGTRNCARLLEQFVASGRRDKTLTPIVEKIEKRAVRAAALKVIGRDGRINYRNRFARDLVPELANLAVIELVRLKLARALQDLRSRWSR